GARRADYFADAPGVLRAFAHPTAHDPRRRKHLARSLIMTSSPDKRLYLDDLTVGHRFVSGTHVIDEAEIKAFAKKFDPQPFHLANAAAKSTMFAGLAASGWHTAAITMRLLVDAGLPLAGGIVGAGGTLEWPSPVRPGDTLQVESEVLEIKPSR